MPTPDLNYDRDDVAALASWLEGWCDHDGIESARDCCAWGDAAARVRALAPAADDAV